MFRRPHYIALSTVVLLVLVVFSLPNRTANQLKLSIGSLFLPLFGLAGSANSVAEKTDRSLSSRKMLLQELAALESELEHLRLERMQWTEVAQENIRLRQALLWQQQSSWNLKLARVILRDPADWWRTLQIDLGRRDGVVTNLPVLTSDGLVGRIIDVAYSRSQVILIGDPKCRVAAQVESPKGGGIDGITGTSSALDPTVIELSFVEGQAALQPGQKVVTSGLTGIFPKGIPIGHVIDSSSVDFGMYTEARVKLAADIRHMDEVWVMLP